MTFDVKKTAQAIAVILAEETADSLEYIRILKLLYIAERKASGKSEGPSSVIESSPWTTAL